MEAAHSLHPGSFIHSRSHPSGGARPGPGVLRGEQGSWPRQGRSLGREADWKTPLQLNNRNVAEAAAGEALALGDSAGVVTVHFLGEEGVEESVTGSPGAGVLAPICVRPVTRLRGVCPILAEEGGTG